MSTASTPNFRFSLIVALLVAHLGPFVTKLLPIPGGGLDMVSMQVVLLACSVWFIRRRGITSDDLSGPLPSWRVCVRWLAVAALLPASMGVFCMLVAVLGWMPASAQVVARIMSQTDSVPFEMLIVGSVLAPLTEELAFRGLVLRNCLQRMSVRWAALASAAMFAAIHLGGLMVPQFVGGLFLAVAMLETRSLWLCVLLHAVNNSGADVLEWLDALASTGDDSRFEQLMTALPHPVALAMLVGVALAWVALCVGLVLRLPAAPRFRQAWPALQFA